MPRKLYSQKRALSGACWAPGQRASGVWAPTKGGGAGLPVLGTPEQGPREVREGHVRRTGKGRRPMALTNQRWKCWYRINMGNICANVSIGFDGHVRFHFHHVTPLPAHSPVRGGPAQSQAVPPHRLRTGPAHGTGHRSPGGGRRGTGTWRARPSTLSPRPRAVSPGSRVANSRVRPPAF